MNIDLSYGSGLLAVVSDVNKMKLFETIIRELSNDIFGKEMKKQLIESASSGDDVMFATTFHEQNIPQKKVIVAILKALQNADDIEILRIKIKPAIDPFDSIKK